LAIMKRRTVVSFAAAAVAGLVSGMIPGASFAAEPTYREFVHGDPKAKVTVIEYASLTCPHCAHFAENDFPKIKKEYIDTGKVKFVFRDFPLDGLATAGALMARCAPGDRGKVLVEVLFKNQGEWLRNDRQPIEGLRNFAKLSGMSDADIDACLKNQKILGEITDVKDKAERLYKVQSTPTFFVGETMIPGVDYDALKKAIDKALK